jgi:thymidylate synthase
MPAGNPWNDITKLFEVEGSVRKGGADNVAQTLPRLGEVDPYWADFGRLFGIYALTRGEVDVPRERLKLVVELRKAMSNDFYTAYIRKRAKKLTQQIIRLDLDGPAGAEGAQ